MENHPTHQTYLSLKNQLNFHNYRYHVLDAPIISDGEYDRMLIDLRKMEAHHPEWISPDSPTQRSGAPPADRFERVSHPVPILSLANAFNTDDLEDWYKRILKMDSRVSTSKFVLEPKIDGLTVVLHYQGGIFVKGTTRGNGEVGEDITQNIKTIASVPLKIPVSKKGIVVPDNLVVRAEAFISLSDFKRLNQKFSSQGLRTYQNPRNTAAGSLRMLDSSIVADRPLKIIAYSIVSGNPKSTQWDTLQYLKDLGFPIPEIAERCNDKEAMIANTEKWDVIREQIDYEIDGVVIKLNDLTLSADLGYVGKDPRGAIALKFPAQVVTTLLNEIGVQVGRTGVLTPFAILEPVDIGGVTVKQATLHNFDFIKNKDIRIGDRVMVKRAGEVIPYIMGPIKDVRAGDEIVYQLPKTCPSCGEPIEKVEGEVAWYCVNNACPAQIIRNIEHFVSRNAMDIVGLGIRIVEQLVQAELVDDVADLYGLKKQDLMDLEGFAEKKADNIIEAIAASKSVTLSRLITALGIHGIGDVAAEQLAARYKNLDAVAKAKPEEIESIDGFGPSTAKALNNWFSFSRNKTILKKLKSFEVWPQAENTYQSMQTALSNKRFVITGALASFSRNEIKAFIKARGGSVTDNVSSKTDFLVVGEKAGSKLDNAKALGIPVIDEQTLLSMSED